MFCWHKLFENQNVDLALIGITMVNCPQVTTSHARVSILKGTMYNLGDSLVAINSNESRILKERHWANLTVKKRYGIFEGGSDQSTFGFEITDKQAQKGGTKSANKKLSSQVVCVTTHKGSWVKLLLCLISTVTRSSSHLVREVNQTQGSKHCFLLWKMLRKRAIWRIFKIS